MIVQEGLPGLAGRPRQSPKDARDSPFGDFDAEHLQLAVNSGGRAIADWPQPSVQSNAVSQTESRVYRDGAASLLRFLPAKPLALSADDGFGSDVFQRSAPAFPEQGKRDPE